MKKLLWYTLVMLSYGYSLFINGQELPQDYLGGRSKEEIAQQLVLDAADHFTRSNLSISQLCAEFMHSSRWVTGEITLFMCNVYGTCYVEGSEPFWIWKNFSHLKTLTHDPLIPTLLATGQRGGWVSYEWNNDVKRSFVKDVVKDGKTFIIGAGFYPASATSSAQQLLERVQTSLNEHGFDETVTNINDPFGIFVKGNISMRLIDFNGINIADGVSRIRVGQNVLGERDEAGKFIVRDILRIAQGQPGYGWTECLCNRAYERLYVQRIIDPRTKKVYAGVAGYYPTSTRDSVIDFVKKAAEFLRANGIDEAFREFSNSAGEFSKGDMRIYLYKPDGTVIYDGYHPTFTDENIRNIKDRLGRPITQRILDRAQQYGKGWVTYLFRNYYFYSYLEKVEIPDGVFIVGSGYWSWSKEPAVRSLVEEAVAYLQTHRLWESMQVFTTSDSDFLRGDLSIEVIDLEGFTWAKTQQWDAIWQQFAQGEPALFERLRAAAERGGGWVELPRNNAIFRMFVRPAQARMEESNRSERFIILSGYYI